MAVSRVGSTYISGALSTTGTIPLPSGWLPGDVAVVALGASLGESGYSINAQFLTAMDAEVPGRATADNGNTQLRLGARTLVAGDSGINVRFSDSGGNGPRGYALLTVFRGVRAVRDGFGSLSNTSGGPAPTYTTTRAANMVVFAGIANGSGVGCSYPVGFTADQQAPQGNGTYPPAVVLAVKNSPSGAPGSYGGEAHQSSGLYSATAQAVMALIVPSAPSTPTLTNPANPTSGAVNRLAWAFSDPDSGDSQTAWEVEYRATGTTRATSVSSAGLGGSTGTQQYWDAPAGSFYGPVQWRSRVADTGPTFSDWSDWSTFTCPVVPGTSGSPAGSSAQGQFHDPTITPAIAALYGLTGSPTQTPARTGSLLGRLKAAMAGALDQPGGATATGTTATVSVAAGGAWTQVNASTAKALVTSVRLATDESSAGAARLVRFDLGVGAAGAEVAVATVWLAAQTFTGWVRLPAPVLINAGERLSVRLAPLDATRSLSVRSVPL